MTRSPLASLERIRSHTPVTAPGERCELCAVDLDERHRHLVDLHTRSLRCACRACALLFEHPGAAGGHYVLVPDRWVRVEGFAMNGNAWESLQIPVSVAFFVRQQGGGQPAAFYPGPAGATESLLPMGAWDELAEAHPVLAGLEADVEAALIRIGDADSECYVVPVDACYELVGRLRQSWRGFDGGADSHREIEAFFTQARARSRPARGAAGA